MIVNTVIYTSILSIHRRGLTFPFWGVSVSAEGVSMAQFLRSEGNSLDCPASAGLWVEAQERENKLTISDSPKTRAVTYLGMSTLILLPSVAIVLCLFFCIYAFLYVHLYFCFILICVLYSDQNFWQLKHYTVVSLQPRCLPLPILLSVKSDKNYAPIFRQWNLNLYLYTSRMIGCNVLNTTLM